ncbi:DDE-type integrase/transposase/recombinase, partial [Halarsenatibacter silvermanii]
FIEPNDCWSLDFLEFNWGSETLYLCLILDDKSRYVLEWSITASPTFEFVKDLLEQAFKQHGKPKMIKSDNGPQFRKKFAEQLNQWDIVHHPSPYYQPSYNGKTERKNRDLRKIVERFDEDVSLEQIFSTISDSIYEHNHIRPHESLEGATPYQSYNGFADEVRAKMEAFKKREKRRKGFKVKDSKQNQNHNPGVSVPVYSRNESEDVVGCVKSFLEVQL